MRWQSQTAFAEEITSPTESSHGKARKENRDAFIQRQQSQPVKLSPAAFALKHRLGLQDALSDALFLQALTHKSFEHGWVATNERLAYLGISFSLFTIPEVIKKKKK